jgi:hypothetical protein
VYAKGRHSAQGIGRKMPSINPGGNVVVVVVAVILLNQLGQCPRKDKGGKLPGRQV